MMIQNDIRIAPSVCLKFENLFSITFLVSKTFVPKQSFKNVIAITVFTVLRKKKCCFQLKIDSPFLKTLKNDILVHLELNNFEKNK